MKSTSYKKIAVRIIAKWRKQSQWCSQPKIFGGAKYF